MGLGIVVTCIWGTVDPLVFNVILGSFSALVINTKQLALEKTDHRESVTLIKLKWGDLDLVAYNVI